jgi:hypothetical protein
MQFRRSSGAVQEQPSGSSTTAHQQLPEQAKRKQHRQAALARKVRLLPMYATCLLRFTQRPTRRPAQQPESCALVCLSILNTYSICCTKHTSALRCNAAAADIPGPCCYRRCCCFCCFCYCCWRLHRCPNLGICLETAACIRATCPRVKYNRHRAGE